ncbi:MAG: hypothetical protein NC395_08575 [Prevotella sp.]|nr:hypothetical protein [Prevotella sp.]
MKNPIPKITAILAAALMTVSTAGTSLPASADTEAPKYTGWLYGDGSWRYLEDGVPYASKYYTESLEADGIRYGFTSSGVCIGKYTGRSEDGKLYYKNGLPYTGWTDGNKQYCLDGYPVTGDFQIGDRLYSFDKKGAYTGESSPAALTASVDGKTPVDGKISSDAEKITVTVRCSDGDGDTEYTVGEPTKMERWENGSWKDCRKSSEYAADGIARKLGGSSGSSANFTQVSFYPQKYTGDNMSAGYYRITVPVTYGKTKRNLYAVFEAVPPVEVKTTEEIYRAVNGSDTTISIILTVNSDKENLSAEKIASDGGCKLDVMKKTAAGWESLGELDNVCAGFTDTENELEILADIPPETGYCKAVVTAGGAEYSAPFRVEPVPVTPWLDEYSLKKDDITVSFTVRNRLETPLKLNSDPYRLYKISSGNLESVPEAETSTCRGEEARYITLEQGQFGAVSFKLSEYYDVSKLEAGDYAVLIDGAGLAEFRLADKEEEKGSFPFSSLKREDVKEIQFTLYECGSDHTLTASFKNGNDPDGYLERSVDFLRQLEFKRAIEKYTTDAAGGSPLEVTVRLTNGRKKTLYFYESGAVLYNGSKTYICGENVCPALYDFVIENNDVDRKYYGYRNTP